MLPLPQRMAHWRSLLRKKYIKNLKNTHGQLDEFRAVLRDVFHF